jgi:hypothetical protein
VGGVVSSTTSTTVLGAASTVSTPRLIQAGGGGTADGIRSWRILALLGAMLAATLALVTSPLGRKAVTVQRK